MQRLIWGQLDKQSQLHHKLQSFWLKSLILTLSRWTCRFRAAQSCAFRFAADILVPSKVELLRSETFKTNPRTWSYLKICTYFYCKEFLQGPHMFKGSFIPAGLDYIFTGLKVELLTRRDFRFYPLLNLHAMMVWKWLKLRGIKRFGHFCTLCSWILWIVWMQNRQI